ncbi:MAG: hypothetical protein VYC34_08125, partial [Planctomycetota bacterium]|nr:hypothetical protein [Planctomycetota bacterium]
MSDSESLDRRINAEFRPALESIGLAALDSSHNVAYAIDRSFRIVYFNQAWLRFSADNGGEPLISRDWGLGRQLTACIAEPLRPYIESTYAECLAGQRPAGFEFECSGPGVFRRYRQSVYPLGTNGLVLVNSIVVEHPFTSSDRATHDPDRGLYLDASGLIVQCCHCRRTRRADDLNCDRWDWVPAWVSQS